MKQISEAQQNKELNYLTVIGVVGLIVCVGVAIALPQATVAFKASTIGTKAAITAFKVVTTAL